MAAKRHERTTAREIALQVLYSGLVTESDPADIVRTGMFIDENGVFDEYAQRLVAGVSEKLDEIDDCLVDASENWPLGRMPLVDLSILRLATYEMLFVDEVPLSVSINEAVELAKYFGGEDESHRFVNGVLGRIAKQIEAGIAVTDGAKDSTNAQCDEPAASVSDEGASEDASSVQAEG